MWKFNNGNGALVCDFCRTIIQTPFHPDDLDREVAFDKCTTCKEKLENDSETERDWNVVPWNRQRRPFRPVTPEDPGDGAA